MFKEKKIRQSKWLRLGVLLVTWLFIWSLLKGLDRVKKGFERIDQAKTNLEIAQEQNTGLKQKMKDVQTKYYEEKVIRNKLDMQLPGEIVVVLPDSGVTTSENGAGEVKKTESNWEKWWNVIK